MSGDDFSVLDHLKQVAIKLRIPGDDGLSYFDDLTERNIVDDLYQYYQILEAENQLNKVDNNQEMEKIQTFDNISALELLPNEVYEHILRYSKSEEKRSLRLASKRLYEKTTLMDDMFNRWYISTSHEQDLPDFVLESRKNFQLEIIVLTNDHVVAAGNRINRFAHRTSHLKILCRFDLEDSLVPYLTDMKPTEFPYLTYLNLFGCTIDNKSLLLLSSQLETLKLQDISIDLSSVSYSDNCFTKLKTLSVVNCKIDMSKILTKCSKSLVTLTLKVKEGEQLDFDDLRSDLKSLKFVYIECFAEKSGSIRNILSKVPKNLQELKLSIETDDFIDFSTLIDQSMVIKTLMIRVRKATNIEYFLRKCPLVQKLNLIGFKRELKKIELNDLIELYLYDCNSICMTSILQCSTNSCLKFLYIDNDYDDLTDCKYPILPRLETVMHSDSTDINGLNKLFPEDAEVLCEEEEENTSFKRVYNI